MHFAYKNKEREETSWKKIILADNTQKSKSEREPVFSRNVVTVADFADLKTVAEKPYKNWKPKDCKV